MDYVFPKDVAKTMVTAGTAKASLSVKDLLIRGFLSGALLGFAVTLAFVGASQTKIPLVGAIIFPVSFVMIVILGLELVTGSFALVPLAYFERKISFGKMVSNLFWAFTGNLIGSVFYALLYWVAVTKTGSVADAGEVAKMLATASEAKTTGYSSFGMAGLFSAFVKAILCNWMVCLGVVMAMTSKSTLGKITAAWLPIFIFFALGYEHSVVNMFLIPAGMLFGSNVTMSDWWMTNQIIVTVGNLVGGLTFTGIAIYYTHREKEILTVDQPAQSQQTLQPETTTIAASA